jgi:hypothetical protein
MLFRAPLTGSLLETAFMNRPARSQNPKMSKILPDPKTRPTRIAEAFYWNNAPHVMYMVLLLFFTVRVSQCSGKSD